MTGSKVLRHLARFATVRSGAAAGLLIGSLVSPALAIQGGEAARSRDGVASATAAIYAVAPADNPKGLTRCSGVLVRSDQLLTAAHCVEGTPKGFLVVFYRGGAPSLPVRTATVQARFRPERATGLLAGFAVPQDLRTKLAERSNDLALLKLSEPVRDRRPLPLATDGSRIPTSLRLAGIGLDGGVPTRQRTARLKPLAVSDSGLLITQSVGARACVGDSGGPVVGTEGGRAYVWGVASAAIMPRPPCGEYIAVAPASKITTGAPAF